jgi:hypothetical protein
MVVIGEIIKKSVEVADKVFTNAEPAEAQKEVLKELISKATNTAFGEHYNFKQLLSSESMQDEFAQSIPYHSYEKIKEEWWQKVIDGEENITWPGKVKYFAVSSGTTSTRKHIPVTDDMLKSIRKAGLQQIKSIADFDLPATFFEKEILMFGSSTDLQEVNGHFEGEISGISASQIPFWFEGFYRPGEEISSINDWDERVEALAKEAPKWDICTISGIPSWIELMLKRVINYHNADTIHDVWPNLQVYTSGGVAFEPYRKSFEKISREPLIIIDTYLASEGYIATQKRKDTDAMALITDNGIYFEFVPFLPENIDDEGNIKPGVKSLKIDEVVEGHDYVLIISTVAGAWRYMIGDTITFTDKSRAEIKITGRTKHFLNVVGSQLSVIQMNAAIEDLKCYHDCNIKEFTVAAVLEEGDYLHRWYLGVEGIINMDEKEVARQLDAILQDNNKNYKVARGKALRSVEVKLIPVELFMEFTEKTRQKGGQVKVQRVMKESDFKNWEAFVKVIQQKE